MRVLKQTLYAFLYIVLWSGVFAGIYFWYLRPATASCFNGKQDYNEAGADCGGACAKVCLPDLAPVQVAAVDVAPLNSPNQTSILIELRNPNPDFAAYGDLNVTLRAAGGSALGSESFSIRLAPGDIYFLGVPAISASTTIADADAVFALSRWAPGGSLRKMNLAVNILGVGEKGNNIEISGTVINNDSATAGSAEILARLYDANGVLRGISQTVLDRVAPRESRPFSILHPKIQFAPEKTSVTAAAYLVQ